MGLLCFYVLIFYIRLLFCLNYIVHWLITYLINLYLVVLSFNLELVADGATEQNHLFLPPSSFPLPQHPVEAFLNAGGDDDLCFLARYQTLIILQVLLSVHL